MPPESALEREYLFRDRHPDRDAIYEQQQALSARAQCTLQGLHDLSYADHPDARLDVYPARQTAAPILAFFHGGYWRSNRKEDFAFLAPPLVEAGISLVLVGYPLAPAVPLARIAACAAAALRFIRANAARWGGSSDDISVAGHSAGGHLAALTAGEVPVRGCIALSGIFDLRPLHQTSLASLLPSDAESLAALTPHPALAGRFLDLYVGREETPAFLRQSETFAALARAAGTEVYSEILPGLHHYNIPLSLADPDSALFRRVMRRLQS